MGRETGNQRKARESGEKREGRMLGKKETVREEMERKFEEGR